MLGVRLDGLDHQVEFVGAVDLPGDAIVLARCGCVGFGEVMQPINATCRVVSHEQNGTGAVFHPREQEQVIGAEVKHAGETREREPQLPRPLAAPLRGYPADSSGPEYRHSAAPDRGRQLLSRRCRTVFGFAKAIAAEDLRVFHEPIHDCSGDCRIEEDVAPFGEGGVGRNERGTLLAVASGDDLVKQIGRLLI
jgi:hypothetical protein